MLYPVTTRQAWTLSDAAQRVGVSRSTLRRRREQGSFPNAYRDAAGQWRIPIEDLLAAGFHPGNHEPAQAAQPSTVGTPTGQAHGSTEQANEQALAALNRIRELETALAVEQAHREGLERTLEQAVRRSEIAESALRMIEPPRIERLPEPSPAPLPASEQASEQAQPAHGRRSPWRDVITALGAVRKR
jgi:hypothetical protein